MAINNFIPTIWSEHLYNSMKNKRIGAEHCNRVYEGEILGKGSTVRICGLEDVTISDYTKNTNMNEPQVLNDNYRDLVIDQAKYFNFLIDDIDRVQATPQLMELAINNTAVALANKAEWEIFNQYYRASHTTDCFETTPENVFNHILDARTKILEANVDCPDDIVVELSPRVAGFLYRAKILYSSDNNNILETGYIGNIGGCKVYVSTQIAREIDDYTDTHHCLIRTKRAIAFAEQLSEIEAYRPELRFADAVKGLYLFGCKTVYPQEMVDMRFVFNI